MINFFNISNQDKKIKSKIIKKISEIIETNSFINGKEVDIFEKRFANYCSVKNCISVANGTDALFIALKSLNLKKNDEVIVPAMTWKSTLIAPLNLNLKTILVDVEKNSSNIDIVDLKRKISKKTKVIIIVHLYGNPVNIKEIKKIIKKKKIFIIEDAAQAHGAIDYSTNKKVGSLGNIACFSFYPGKNLGSYGDGGCLTTNDPKLAKKIRIIKNLGSNNKFDCEIQSVNSRLDTIQAAILNLKLNDLKKNNLKRLKIAKFYRNNIKNNKVSIIKYQKGSVYHQFVIISILKNKIINIFKKNKIQYGQHYPISVNNLKIVKKKFQKSKFPNAEKLAKFSLSLPIDPNLNLKQLKKICQLINKTK